jgi:glycosyltransferase involved in cell wall biosynthesis
VNLETVLGEIARVFADTPHEIVVVDDGSTDGSWEELVRLGAVVRGLVPLRLAGPTGQSAALLAGCEAARAPVIVTLDADGQNDPADARKLLAALEGFKGYDAAVGYRVRRQDSAWRLLQSRIANGVRNRLTGDRVRDTACGLKAMRRERVLALPRFDGMHRFFPTLLRREGGRVLEVPVGHRPRAGGRSKYGMWNRVFRTLRDALGVRWLGRRRLAWRLHREGAP